MQQPNITLTIQRGPQRGQRFSVAKDSIILGRVMGSDVVVSDRATFGRHTRPHRGYDNAIVEIAPFDFQGCEKPSHNRSLLDSGFNGP